MEWFDLQKEIDKALKDFKSWWDIQNDRYDSFTRYIYTTNTYDELVENTKKTCEIYKLQFDPVFRYALNRWFNNVVSHFAEDEFTKHDIVEDEEDIYNKEIDFYIKWIPFDLKMSVFPKGFWNSIDYAVKHKDELIEWMYKHCSKWKRLHNWNKIFVVCYSPDWNHNMVKGNLKLISEAIDKYINDYNEWDLTLLDNSLSDVIFVFDCDK